MQAEDVLQHYWGYPHFRPGQAAIIEAILRQPEVIAIMPTGGGKSICFQVPALMLEGLTLVISPLISLMKDQVDALLRRGIAAAHLSSTQTPDEQARLYQQLDLLSRVKNNQATTQQPLKLLYLSPERLQSRRFLASIKTIPVSLLVIDEAHCIAEWGHDFRPEFRQIPRLLHHLPTRPKIAAFTATATPAVQAEIATSLRLNSPRQFLSSFERDNLAIQVDYCPSLFTQQLTLLRLINQNRLASGIIYVSSRSSAEALAALIQKTIPQLSVGFYHAGLTGAERDRIQELFLNDRLQIITATNAFGMGIDKSSIRFVVHYQIPASLEHYYQEIGRAGRDRLPSTTTLLFNPYNLQIHLKLLAKNSTLTTRYRHRQLAKLAAMRSFALTPDCRSQFILRYFGEQASTPCHRCDNCRHRSTPHPLLNQLSSVEKERLQNLFLIREKIARHYRAKPPSVVHPQLLCQLALRQQLPTEDQLLTLPGAGAGWQQRWWPRLKKEYLNAF